jgi:hypothetical protein
LPSLVKAFSDTADSASEAVRAPRVARHEGAAGTVSVPTTLQGTHDGCGGTVVFRPGDHRAALLAGETVVLRSNCRTCGATLSTEWQLPQAEALPMAAGAEEWQPMSRPTPASPARAHEHGHTHAHGHEPRARFA